MTHISRTLSEITFTQKQYYSLKVHIEDDNNLVVGLYRLESIQAENYEPESLTVIGVLR